MPKDAGTELQRLVGIMARLRSEGGCPWDREQDLRSLRPYLIEEAYEVLDEMDRVSLHGGSWQPLCEELGDLLFQIVFHAQLAHELGEFDIAEVCAAISDKLTRRHPHVFATQKVTGAEQVLQNWAKLKAEERRKKHGTEGSVLDGVPSCAPALQRAERLTEKASRVGFDWPDLEGVRAKLYEELRELDEAIAQKDRDAIEHELGDVLFSLANVARFVNTPPEDALRQANARFVRRFQEIEAGLREQQIPFGEATLDQMEALWQRAKQKEANASKVSLRRAALMRLRFPLRDAERMGAFWDRLAPLLGWRRRERTGADVAYELGNQEVWFVAALPGEAGAAEHLLEASSRAAVDAVTQALASAGGQSHGPDEALAGAYGVSFRDPDGNLWRYGLIA